MSLSSGSGPSAAAVSTAALSTTAETVIATLPPGNWNNPQGTGVLIEAQVTATASGAATITLRVRQGSLTGTLVTGSTQIYTFAGAATTVDVGGPSVTDLSAFGVGPTQQGVYVLTAQASVSSTITPTGGVLTLETVAPIQ